jgi:hypothetical protein
VQPFPWAAVWVDGEKIKPEEVCYYHEFIDKRHLDEVVFLSAGTHQLDYRFDPPRLWLILRLSSFVWAGIWALLLILVGNKSRFLGLKRAPKLEAAKVRAV